MFNINKLRKYKNRIAIVDQNNETISYNDLLDYDIDPYISFDMILFFNNISLDDINEILIKCKHLINKNGQIWIFTHKSDGELNKIKNKLNIENYGDNDIINTININCKIFNTHIPTFLKSDTINKNCLSQI